VKKNMLSRRKFLGLSAITAAGALIAACQPGSIPASSSGAMQAPSTEPAAVTYWNYMTNMEEIEGEILEAFNTARSDIAVNYEFIPWQQYWQKLNATLAAGNPPDLWNTAPTFYYEYILRDQLADLTELIDMSIDMSEFHETALSGYDFDNKLYGVPRNIVTQAIYFNKDIFAQAGVEPPPLDGNWTFEDMLEKALAITQDTDGDGKIDIWGTEALQNGGHLDSFIMANGGEIFKGEFRRDLQGMEANYESDSARATYQYFADLINLHEVSYRAGEFEGMGDPFMTGRLGMKWNLNWGALTYNAAPFDWDVTLAPKGSQSQLTYGGADGLVLANASNNKDASWQLVLWLINPETGGPFLTESGAMPVLDTQDAMDSYRQTFPEKNMDAFVNSARMARNTFTLGYSEWKAALRTELEQAFLGSKPVDQMCIDANAAVNAALERIRVQFAEATQGG
jgi:multiple sugar transport system substrate-binding protein